MGAAGLAGAAALGLPAKALAAPTASMDDLLYRASPGIAPVPLATLRTAVAKARGYFQA